MSDQPAEETTMGERDVAQGEEVPTESAVTEGHDRVDSPGGTFPQVETESIEGARHLGAASETVHPDGWNEATHGPHPSTRSDSGI